MRAGGLLLKEETSGDQMKKRLEAIINITPPCGTVADIGCDHGKIAVGLLLCGKAKKAVCTDISEKSLYKAQMLAESEGLSESVLFRAGDGLKALKAGEADAAVIAGMGGDLISRILEEGKERAPETLVIGCNTKPEKARRWLSENGYRIEDEDMAHERSHFYSVILAKRGAMRRLSETELELGPALLKKKPPEFMQYLQLMKEKTLRERACIIVSESENTKELIRLMDEKIRRYEEATAL